MKSRVAVLALITAVTPMIASAQPGATPAPGAPEAAQPWPSQPNPSAPDPSAGPSGPPAGFDPSTAAGPGATPPLVPSDPNVLTLARGAHAAAVRGDCVGARVLGTRIYRLDPAYHRAVIRTDPAITSCRPAPRSVAVTETDEASLPAREGTPPTDGGAIAGEVLVGALFGTGGGLIGAFAGAGLECSGGCNSEFGGLGGAILGGMVGMTLFIPIGVNLAGDSDTVEGSFGAALGGSVVGMLLGTAILAGSQGESGGAVVMFFASPLAGAIIGFNVTRTYKPGTANVSLVPVPTKIGDGIGLSLATGTF